MPCRCRRLCAARRVDEHERRVAALHDRVDRVARRPGISETDDVRPSSLLTRLDLPTFGRPRIATRIASSGSSGRAPVPCALRIDDLVQEVAGAAPVHGDRDRKFARPSGGRARASPPAMSICRDHEHRLLRLAGATRCSPPRLPAPSRSARRRTRLAPPTPSAPVGDRARGSAPGRRLPLCRCR